MNNNICILIYARTFSTLFIALEQGQVDVIKIINKIVVDEKNLKSASTRFYIVESKDFANRDNIVIGIVHENKILFVKIRQIY